MSSKAKKSKIRFVCQSCGYLSPRWMGHCSECNEWNSFVEETIQRQPGSRRWEPSKTDSNPVPIRLSEIEFNQHQRLQARSGEFNRVLGGGIVSGSLILLGGDPGIGKSTLMLQESVALAGPNLAVLYVSGEESLQQTKLRAERLKLNSDKLFLLAETDMSIILAAIEKLEPQAVVIDSIQTVFLPAFESSPGSVGQVRQSAFELLQLAKRMNIPIFIIGHVTKEGQIAGPKVLEHMVDVLLQFEGDRDHFYRILRSVKNRFGSTREIGIFEMSEAGLEEVANPSAMFLDQRKSDVSGSSVVCTMKGTRPFLVEIQALVSSANYGLPQRTAAGIDNKRLALLLAVLEKRVGFRMGAHDVFVNAAGGVRIDEPSADLGILTSIASSFQDRVVASDAIIVGEVGLGGEIRAVPQIDKRIDEAAKMGFQKAVIPELNLKGIKNSGPLQIAAINRVEEALEEVLN